MGLSRVVQFLRSVRDSLQVPEVQVAPTSESIPVTAEHYAPPGVDAVPMEGDTAVTAPGTGSGRWVVMGYMDTANAGTAGPGEFRIYSRNGDGEIVASIWLKSSGDVVVNGALTVDGDGNMVIGSDADSLALSSKVDLFVDAFVNAVPVAQDGGAAIQEAVSTAIGLTFTSASERVKVDS